MGDLIHVNSMKHRAPKITKPQAGCENPHFACSFSQSALSTGFGLVGLSGG